MTRTIVALGALLPATACGGANVRPLPVSSAIIVHACGLAEADYHMRQSHGGGGSVCTGTIKVDATSADKLNPSISSNSAGEIDVGAEKSVETPVDQLPTLTQCKAWGYVPQLGRDGCLPRTPSCSFIETKDLPDESAEQRKQSRDKQGACADTKPKGS